MRSNMSAAAILVATVFGVPILVACIAWFGPLPLLITGAVGGLFISPIAAGIRLADPKKKKT